MGWVEMSERELRRAEVLASVFAGRLTMTAAAALMGVTRRQAHRLARMFEKDVALVFFPEITLPRRAR
jgi:cytochrome P450